MKPKSRPSKTPESTLPNGTRGASLEEGEHGADVAAAADSSAAQKVLDRDEAQEVQAIMDTMRNEGGQGAYIRLLVKRKSDVKYFYLTKLPLDSFSEETVKENYGGGEYIAEGRKASGAIVKTYRFAIDHNIPAKNPDVPKPAEKPSDAAAIIKELVVHLVPLLKPAPAAAAPVQDNSILVAMMTNTTQMMVEAQKSNAQMMTALFSSMNKNNGADPQIASLLNRMDRAIEKMADAQSSPKQKSGAADLLELLEVIDRVREKEPNEDKRSLLSQLGEVAAPFVKAFAGGVPPLVVSSLDPTKPGAGAPPALSPRVVSPTAAVETGATPPPPNAQDAMNFAFNQAMKSFAAKAVQAAGMGLTAEQFADAAEDQIPPMYNDKIFEIVSATDWFEKIFVATAGADQHKPWLTELRDIFVEDFGPDSEEEEKK